MLSAHAKTDASASSVRILNEKAAEEEKSKYAELLTTLRDLRGESVPCNWFTYYSETTPNVLAEHDAAELEIQNEQYAEQGSFTVNTQYVDNSDPTIFYLQRVENSARKASEVFKLHAPIVVISKLDNKKEISHSGFVAAATGETVVVKLNSVPTFKKNQVVTLSASDRDIIRSYYMGKTFEKNSLLIESLNWKATGKLYQWQEEGTDGDGCDQDTCIDPELTYDSTLNELQKKAARMGINRLRPIVSIQGPPGTGKTAVLAEIAVEHLIARRKFDLRRRLAAEVLSNDGLLVRPIIATILRIIRTTLVPMQLMIAAPTRMALNNVLDRFNERLQELGFPNDAGFGPYRNKHVMTQTDLAEIISNDEGMKLKMAQLLDAVKTRNFARISMLSLEYSEMHSALKEKLMEGVIVLVGTIQSSLCLRSGATSFAAETLLIEEASQVMEAAVWPAAAFAQRLVVCGDHMQLPPMILSTNEKASQVKESLLTRFNKISKKIGPCVPFVRLEIQYRANKSIMQWSNEVFYENSISTDPSVEHRCLPNPTGDKLLMPLVFVNTDLGKQRAYFSSVNNTSHFNNGEALIVRNYVKHLVGSGVPEKDIGVICPYIAQQKLLQKLLVNFEDVALNTIDGFQGQEKGVIIFSFVRNKEDGTIGFLEDLRRVNVAMTRACSQLVIVASEKMLRTGASDSTADDVQSMFAKLAKILSESVVVPPVDVLGKDEDRLKSVTESSLRQHRKQGNRLMSLKARFAQGSRKTSTEIVEALPSTIPDPDVVFASANNDRPAKRPRRDQGQAGILQPTAVAPRQNWVNAVQQSGSGHSQPQPSTQVFVQQRQNFGGSVQPNGYVHAQQQRPNQSFNVQPVYQPHEYAVPNRVNLPPFPYQGLDVMNYVRRGVQGEAYDDRSPMFPDVTNPTRMFWSSEGWVALVECRGRTVAYWRYDEPHDSWEFVALKQGKVDWTTTKNPKQVFPSHFFALPGN